MKELMKSVLVIGTIASLAIGCGGEDPEECETPDNNNPEELQPNAGTMNSATENAATMNSTPNTGTMNSTPNTGTMNSTPNTGTMNSTTNNTSNNTTGNSGTNSGNMGMGNTGEPDPNSVTLPDASEFMYAGEATFTLDGLLGGYDGAQTADGGIVCTEGCEDNLQQSGSVTLFPIDTGWGWDVIDFVGATEKPRDGVYDDGWAGEIKDADGNVIGLAVSTVATKKFKTGPRKGGWCSGLKGDPTKCITEHRVVAEHVLTCHETIPYMYYDWMTGEPTTSDYEVCSENQLNHEFDRPLDELTEYLYDIDGQAFTESYAMRLGEHPGEWKMVWGDLDKRPTDVRVVTRVPLPEEFKGEATYNITRAELAIVHTITNNPNDKIRPEDIDNESAIGKEPRYTVDEDGRWLSAVDCYEGDGDFIPAGTVLRNPSFADPTWITEDVAEGFTNAWYTSLDREPLEWNGENGPRWRLKNPKFGQDLPGYDIPVEPCMSYPLKKDQIKYERGAITVTHINLLDPEEGEILFKTNWDFVTPDPDEIQEGETNLTHDGTRLSEDLDLVIYIKGDRNPVRLYKAVLYLDYEPAEAPE